MEPAPAPKEPLNVEKLTDEELIELFPCREEESEPTEEEEEPGEGELTIEEKIKKKWREAAAKLTAQERQAIEELWRRYSKSIEKYLRYKVFAQGSTFCPRREPSKKHFVTMCVNETYLKFLTSTSRPAIKKTVQAFVIWTTLCAARDLRRQIDKIRGSAKADDKKKKPKKPPVEMGPLDDQKPTPDEDRTPEELAALRELRDILDKYAAESPQNMLSIRVARLKRGEKKTWQEVLATIEGWLPGAVAGSTPGAKQKKLRDFEKHDTKNILPRLQNYNITDPSLFDVLLEVDTERF